MGLINNKNRKIHWIDVSMMVVCILLAVSVVPIIMMAQAHYLIDAIVSFGICGCLFTVWIIMRKTKKCVLTTVPLLERTFDVTIANTFHLNNNKNSFNKKDIMWWIMFFLIFVSLYVAISMAGYVGQHIRVMV